MVFSSMIFLWAFLPIVFILDKIAGKSRKLQNILLLAASLLFYAWGEPRYMWLLLVSILANYALGLFMDGIQGQGRRKFILIAGILVNLGILGYYKYFNFFINTLNKIFGRELLSMKDIALPLGVSFFTFQAMTYLIDLYKKKYPAQKNVLNMALYFSFFPKITQGPIEKYRDFEKQLTQRQQSLTLMGEGIRRFVYGLAKKVIIADTLGACVDRIYGLDLGNKPSLIERVRFLPKNDANFIEPGHKYEMLYYDNRWISLGMHIARCDSLVYEIPANSLTLVRDLTAGKEERPFTYREHTPQWW